MSFKRDTQWGSEKKEIAADKIDSFKNEEGKM